MSVAPSSLRMEIGSTVAAMPNRVTGDSILAEMRRVIDTYMVIVQPPVEEEGYNHHGNALPLVPNPGNFFKKHLSIRITNRGGARSAPCSPPLEPTTSA